MLLVNRFYTNVPTYLSNGLPVWVYINKKAILCSLQNPFKTYTEVGRSKGILRL